MENEKKDNIFNIVSMFFTIIIAGSFFSGLGRLISGIGLHTGIVDGFFIGYAIYISIYLLKIPFLERINIQKYSVLHSIIIGFLVGGIPGIILHNKFIFYTSGLSSSLLCLSFVLLEKYAEKQSGNLIKLLPLYFFTGTVAGFIGNLIFNTSVQLHLIELFNIKIILSGALYGAIWGGLIIAGIKLSILYLNPLLKKCISPIILSTLHGIAISIGTGLFGIIIETINYTNTNFDMTATGARSLSQAITLSFLRDASFGLCFGFLFTILHYITPYKKIENPLYIISGGLAGFLSSIIAHKYFLFVLSPINGLLLGLAIGLGVFISNTKNIDAKKKRAWALMLCPTLGFLILLTSAIITIKNESFFYLLSFGFLGAIYGFIIIILKFVCDYYLESDSVNNSIIKRYI